MRVLLVLLLTIFGAVACSSTEQASQSQSPAAESAQINAQDNEFDSEFVGPQLTAEQRQKLVEQQQKQREQEDYLLGTGDKVDIIVYGEPEMSMRFKVSKSGVVNFPYIGEVKITGRTATEIEIEIEDRLRGDYLLNPMVTLNLEAFRMFYITGEVEDPDGYEYQPRLTVEQAISMAGGFTDRADRGEINIRSGSSDELIEDVELTHPVRPGDTVIVEQSFF